MGGSCPRPPGGRPRNVGARVFEPPALHGGGHSGGSGAALGPVLMPFITPPFGGAVAAPHPIPHGCRGLSDGQQPLVLRPRGQRSTAGDSGPQATRSPPREPLVGDVHFAPLARVLPPVLPWRAPGPGGRPPPPRAP